MRRTVVGLAALAFAAGCSPTSGDSGGPDARDARDADEADGPCERALCNARCVAEGYASGECRENGSCGCEGAGCDDEACAAACRPLGYPTGSCRPTGACACSAPSDGGTTPGSDERCNDNLDNDGDGLVDEGCPCALGTYQDCYGGPHYSRNIGECRDGVQRCVTVDDVPQWGPCEGDVPPATETCNGLDDDCDFITDEGCGECVPSEFGVETSCSDSTDNDCDGMADCYDPDCPPCCREETCGDGIDNNCDDRTDEYCDEPCTPGEYWSIADCRDGRDNDCDGVSDCADPDCRTACCTPEVCDDGNDNDCDGRTDCADPDCGASCCTTENCADDVDNDCDGAADCDDSDCCTTAPCSYLPPCCYDCCIPGTTRTCYLPRYCRSYGTQECKPDGHWGPCVE